MQNRNQNLSGLFSLFPVSPQDRLGRLLRGLGVVSFSAAFVAVIIDKVFSHLPATINAALVFTYGLATLLGILAFIAVGIHVTAQRDRQTFGGRLLKILANIALYVYLPAAIITIIVYIYYRYFGHLGS